MKYADETLMAFADGELEEPLRAQIEQALASDPALKRRIDEHRALRARVERAFQSELALPVPQHLVDLLREPGAEAAAAQAPPAARTAAGAAVIDLAQRRAGIAPRRAARPWMALAASLMLGVTAGYLTFRLQSTSTAGLNGRTLVADAALARALSTSLSGERTSSAVSLGLSYRAKSGNLCRSFAESAITGIACREGREWRIRLLMQTHGADAGYRQAGSALPAPVREAIEAEMVGEPLDEAQERQARSRNWRPQ